MKRIRKVLNKLIHPPMGVVLLLPPVVFAAMIYCLYTALTVNTLVCVIYTLSAYSLVIWIVGLPEIVRRIRAAFFRSAPVQKLSEHELIGHYLNDGYFRSSVGIYQGMAINFLYMIFRVALGICYTSVWFISMAVYYLVLGAIRAYLIVSFRKRDEETERRCYRRTAVLLFLLNIPMGGMIIQMIRTNSSFSYPGYVIYISAFFSFYTMVLAIINLVKYHKMGSPILSAAKVLNFVSAMMSILGLQTAMISRFGGNDEDFRKMMNSLTGGFVYAIVIIIAVYMLLQSKRNEEVSKVDSLGE